MHDFEHEEQMEKTYDGLLMRRLLAFAKPYWHLIALSILLLFIITFGDLVRPYLIKLAIDDYINVAGREYYAYDHGQEPQTTKSIVFNQRIWILKDNVEAQGAGELYTFFLYGKNAYLVPGQLPDKNGTFDVIEQNGEHFIEIGQENIKVILIPKDQVKKFRQDDINSLVRLATLFLGIAVGIFILNFVQVLILQYTGQKTLFDMRQAIFSHIQKLSFSFFDNNPVGKLVTRVTNDTENLNQMYTGVLVNLFKDIFMLVGIIIVMINIHTKLALVCMAAVPFIAFFTVIFRINARKAHRRVRTQLSKINAFLSEHISGMRIIQIFNREKQKQQEFDNNNTGYYKAALKELKVNAVFRPSIEFLFSMALSLLLWYGGGQLIKGNIEFGVLYAFVTYIQMFFQPINDLTEKFNIIQSAMASAEKIFYLLDQNDIIPDPKKPIPLEKVEGRIDFEHVWFAYKEGEWVLRDVSFTIHPGQTVAIVGATGAGKTSIINLMSRFYDVQKGRILIDGIPINRVKKEELRRHIGTVLQDVFLFTGDIESNIRLTSAEISPEKIREVARYVNAHKFIEKLPNKYHEEVMERGATLSTGQRQLLAFARALAFNPSILILDEATANIDTETEELIQDALVKLIEGRTTIAIAHRLSTIQHADKIMVMHRGKIREMGTHQELLSKRGLYYQLYQLQYKNGAVQEAMPY